MCGLLGLKQEAEGTIKQEGREEASKDIDEVVSEDVDGGHAHEDEEEKDGAPKPATTGTQGQEEEDGSDADMAAGKGSGRPFARVVCHVEQMVKKSVRPSWSRHAEVVGEEPVAHIGEDTCGNAVETDGRIVELRPGDWHKDEDDVVNEKRGNDDIRGLHELVVTPEEIVQRDEDYQRKITDIT